MESIAATATTPAALYGEGVAGPAIAAAFRSIAAAGARDARATYGVGARATMESVARELRARGVGSAGLTLHDYIGQTVAGISAAASRAARLGMASAAREAALASRRSLDESLRAQLQANGRWWAGIGASARPLYDEPPDEAGEVAAELDWESVYGDALRELRAQLRARPASKLTPAQIVLVTRAVLLAAALCYFVLAGVSEQPEAIFLCALGLAHLTLAYITGQRV